MVDNIHLEYGSVWKFSGVEYTRGGGGEFEGKKTCEIAWNNVCVCVCVCVFYVWKILLWVFQTETALISFWVEIMFFFVLN